MAFSVFLNIMITGHVKLTHYWKRILKILKQGNLEISSVPVQSILISFNPIPGSCIKVFVSLLEGNQMKTRRILILSWHLAVA
jgi:hypothetical protein